MRDQSSNRGSGHNEDRVRQMNHRARGPDLLGEILTVTAQSESESSPIILDTRDFLPLHLCSALALTSLKRSSGSPLATEAERPDTLGSSLVDPQARVGLDQGHRLVLG